MAAAKTVKVPHLGGITAGYELSADTGKLTDIVNLLAVEPLGHGPTSSPVEHFSYGDSAILVLQAIEVLGIQKAFALRTSQDGWIVARMALLTPDRILGIMPMGTSRDYECADSRAKGGWDPAPLLMPFYEKWSSETETPNFVVDDVWCGMVSGLGYGDGASPELVEFWKNTVEDVYSGDEGRKKLRVALLCLGDIKCPVYLLQGTKDVPYGIIIPREQIKLFTGSKEAKFILAEGGAHYLNATSPKEVADALVELVTKHK
ncbi:hypothetical protein AJ79_05520 [Helicocarpus griseus UAMH5409]|uniref:AB hydrolase-1 domain-containing protein n=1 Tax=Helicocarpus griseus UAMH5409 TaxID=1447875 RepID=A0A2B7XMK5_9EURO|nr:hypothetical protein AJ79_05520 [Helicocarpus griseus UAMH5409]